MLRRFHISELRLVSWFSVSYILYGLSFHSYGTAISISLCIFKISTVFIHDESGKRSYKEPNIKLLPDHESFNLTVDNLMT